MSPRRTVVVKVPEKKKSTGGWWWLLMPVLTLIVIAASMVQLVKFNHKAKGETSAPTGVTWATTSTSSVNDDSGIWVTSASNGVTYNSSGVTYDSAAVLKKASLPPLDPPPAHVRIGPHDYQVKYRLQTALGQIVREKSIIWLRNDLSASALRETVVHEVMHGCIAVGNWYGVSNGRVDEYAVADQEDRYIEAIAPIWLMVLRDNPELVKWLERGPAKRGKGE